MSRELSLPRGSADCGQTWKRKREEDDEREQGRCTYLPDSSANDSRAAVVEWELTFGHPHTLSIMHKEYAIRVTNAGVQIGTERETVKSDGTTATFRGTVMTALEIRFTLSVGHITINWKGERIIINDMYSIDENNLVTFGRRPCGTSPSRSVAIVSENGYEEPMTLSHAKRSYIIRFEEGYPAMVIPRCTYYPLKLLLMKDFIGKFVPKELFGRPSQTPAELADDPRIPNAAPHTPDSSVSADGSDDDLTPPTQYHANERRAMHEMYLPDECSDE